MREPIVIGADRSYFVWNRPTGRLPIPRRVAGPFRSLSELRQHLWNPKRVSCLGFFFVAMLSLIDECVLRVTVAVGTRAALDRQHRFVSRGENYDPG